MRPPIQPQTQSQPLAFFRHRLAVVLGSGIGLLVLGQACSLDEALPSEYRLHATTVSRLDQEADDPEEAKKAVEEALLALFGPAEAPHWPAGIPGEAGAKALAEAAGVYRAECSHCHGLEGTGDGPNSQFLNPKPWNFSTGVFPRSAPKGGEPKVPDMVEILKAGIPTAAMPKFGRLGEPTLRALAGHVLLLARRGRFEQVLSKAYLEGGPEALEPDRLQSLYEELADELEKTPNPQAASPRNGSAKE